MMQTSILLSDLIQLAIEKENRNYSKVIRFIANGFERCGFFNDNNWKEIIQQNFVREESELTQDEIAALLLDVAPPSESDSTISPITKAPVAQSTPFVANLNDKGNDSARGQKRGRSVFDDNNFNESSLLTPMGIRTPSLPRNSPQKKTISSKRKPKITERRNTETTTGLFTSNHKNLRGRVHSTFLPARSVSPNVASVMGLVNGKDAQRTPLLTITNRRMTRKASQLLDAYKGKNGPRSPNMASLSRVSLIFTLIDPKPFKSTLNKFNIYVAELNEKYDYLIADQISQSNKFMCAVVGGKPIISIKWLKALQESDTWQDPLSFLLQDEKGENQYKFSLTATLAKATENKLLSKCSVLVTKTLLRTDTCKDMIISGGGKYLKSSLVPRKGDIVFGISDEKDKSIWPKLKTKYPNLSNIISVEGFLDMIFQYDLSVKPQHKLDN